MELHVADIEATGNPLCFVESLDGQNFASLLIDTVGMIEIFGAEEQGQTVCLDHVGGIGEEEVGVGLQVDETSVNEKMAVAVHEISTGEPFAWILHLGVAEGKPDLLNLVFGKETVDDLDIGA